jgi:thioredoxin 1
MPQVERLETTYGDTIKIVKVDASRNRRLCMELKVMVLPTFLFYKNGEGVARLSGEGLKVQDIADQIRKMV